MQGRSGRVHVIDHHGDAWRLRAQLDRHTVLAEPACA
jgi:hypothetical protein